MGTALLRTLPVHRHGLIVLGLWFAGVVAVHACFWDNCWIEVPLAGVLWLAFLLLGVKFVYRSARQYRWRGGLLALVLALGIATLAWLGVGHWCGWMLRFQIMRWKYEAMVEEIRREPDPEDGKRREIYRHIERTPVLRVAFVFDDRFLSQWRGLVYDPTGEVQKIRQLQRGFSNRYDPDIASVRGLFGGGMAWCTWLWGDWYVC